MYYANHDYTIRTKVVDGEQKYFIKFHEQINSSEIEIELAIFELYYGEFKKPIDRQRNENQRHIESSFVEMELLTVASDEHDIVLRTNLEAALRTCTYRQSKRFIQHYIEGYSFNEIALMEGSDYSTVNKSVKAAVKKIKKYFFSIP